MDFIDVVHPPAVYKSVIPRSDAMKTINVFAAVSDAALAEFVAAGAPDELVGAVPELAPLEAAELAPLVDAAEAAEAFAAAVGTAKPVILPEKGPGAALALAPTPTRLGEGLPGWLGAVFIAACWNASKEPAGALMVLEERR